MWRGKPFSELSTAELVEASDFYQSVLNEVRDHSPMAVWGFFTQGLSDLTLVRFSRPAA